MYAALLHKSRSSVSLPAERRIIRMMIIGKGSFMAGTSAYEQGYMLEESREGISAGEVICKKSKPARKRGRRKAK